MTIPCRKRMILIALASLATLMLVHETILAIRVNRWLLASPHNLAFISFTSMSTQDINDLSKRVLGREEWLRRGRLIRGIRRHLRMRLQIDLLFGEPHPVLLNATGELQCYNAKAELVSCLRACTEWGRVQAALALGRLGDVSVIPPLAHASKTDSDDNVRANALHALADIGGHEAMAAIMRATNDVNDFVRDVAESELRRVQGKNSR